MKDLINAKKYDIIFVQREAFMTGLIMYERGFSRRSKLIFDFDDSIWLPNVSKGNRKLSWLKKPEKTRDIIGFSHLVIAGNAYLAEYAQQFTDNVVVIPTVIDTDVYQPVEKPINPDKICIGWTGSPTTLPQFTTYLSVLHKIKRKYGSRVYFKMVGVPQFTDKFLEVSGIPWKAETEVQDLQEIDIGVMPLPKNKWTTGKCGCKGLQYMALGLPTVMSPVGVNTEIIQDGENGFLAYNEDQWVEKLSQLIESAQLRKDLGSKGRQTVIMKYSVEANKDLYLSHFENLVN